LQAKPVTADKPKLTITPQSDDGDFEMEFSETYNLTRLPPEEAEARLKKIEEMERERLAASLAGKLKP